MTNAVPAGFALWPSRGPFVGSIARLYVSMECRLPVFGIRLEPSHCNGQGFVHGGFVSTLADVWCAYSVASQLDPAARITTASLTVDFISKAAPGDWLHSEVDRIRLGKRLCVVTLAIMCEHRTIALSKASFAVL